MKTIIGLLVFLISALLLASCKSKQWKETVETTIQVKSNNSVVYFGQSTLSLDTLTINVNGFTLSGNRIQAEDIYIVSNTPTSASFIDIEGVFNVTFDIPQGTYESLQLTTELIGQNALQLRGVYEGPLGVTKRVQLDLESHDFLIKPLLEDGGETISIDKKVPKKMTIMINIDSLLADLNPGLWNAAVATGISGQEVIQVSEMQNGNMYNLILGRLSESFNCEVE
ncbi:MAG: hypothetical protein HRT58_08600 [Crocinitomicaceae bacterium]|nr:hypothetical protein [Flavobacteriales bacterium]NQZ35710.1 hypothetical protein [Crocinitomicaceae bacterium]